jgi:hypothetical protein
MCLTCAFGVAAPQEERGVVSTGRDEVVGRLQSLDFHDDAVLATRVVPAPSFRHSARFELELAEYGTSQPRTLVFRGCENIKLDVDLAVLTDNAFGAVAEVTASIEDIVIRSLVAEQGNRLNITYEDSKGQVVEFERRNSKLVDPSSLVLFTVRLYGGTIEIVARDFALKRPRA